MGAVRLLTIGAFGRQAGLTPKALRLYDESGLLVPTAVDPESGYRFYDPAQLDTARLIAELRRVGMPLAQIRTVCALDPAAAADAISAYWHRVSTQSAARARVTALLVEHLSGRATMTTSHDQLILRYATANDPGAVREATEDAVYASDRLLAVADGLRGPGGAAAGAAAIHALKAVELTDAPAAELLTALTAAVADADRAVCALPTSDPQPATTLTALLRAGSQLALVHIGDTRVYLLRDGELTQLTVDHTWVQSQIDQGKLDLAGAAAHPDRALLTRALDGGARPVEADLALRTALPDDRYLLCTDGLWAFVDRAALHTTLKADADPEETVNALLRLAHASGAPDNIACIVADLHAA
jgi:serine/threonine protein phosphatase PrpC